MSRQINLWFEFDWARGEFIWRITVRADPHDHLIL